jgi:Xaa-Pro aminopeptidase
MLRAVKDGDELERLAAAGAAADASCEEIIKVRFARRRESEIGADLRRAQQTAFEAVRPGIACQEVDRAACKVMTDAGYGDYFIHRTGHGIGVTTHEPPYLVEGEARALEPGMCFSIEPGIYFPGGLGLRIEDIVTVTEDVADF